MKNINKAIEKVKLLQEEIKLFVMAIGAISTLLAFISRVFNVRLIGPAKHMVKDEKLVAQTLDNVSNSLLTVLSNNALNCFIGLIFLALVILIILNIIKRINK